MVPNLSQSQLTHLLIEGPKDSIKVQVKPLKPRNLEEEMRKARKVEFNHPKEKNKNFGSKSHYRHEGSKNDHQERPYYICKEPCNKEH